jgi:polyisoprenyl-teichoic acid--peptidoglycan teichoic acid transferase
MLPAGDALSSDQSGTIVYDQHNKPLTTRRIADILNAEIRSGAPAGISSDADIVVVVGQ